MTSRGIEGEGARRTAWSGLPLLYDREMATLCLSEDPTTQGSASRAWSGWGDPSQCPVRRAQTLRSPDVGHVHVHVRQLRVRPATDPGPKSVRESELPDGLDSGGRTALVSSSSHLFSVSWRRGRFFVFGLQAKPRARPARHRDGLYARSRAVRHVSRTNVARRRQ